jgi:hypothetical protein
MGVTASEVGYTSATTGRGDHEVHKGHVVVLGKNLKKINIVNKQHNAAIHHRLTENSFLYRLRSPQLITSIIH